MATTPATPPGHWACEFCTEQFPTARQAATHRANVHRIYYGGPSFVYTPAPRVLAVGRILGGQLVKFSS